MSSQKEQILEKLFEAIGEYKQDRHEIVFKVCPYCKNPKWNFSFNEDKNFFHCWACDEGGHVTKLFRDLKIPFDFKVDFSKKEVAEPKEEGVLYLPDGTVEIKDSSSRAKVLRYLKGRNITEEDIERYKIKFWEPRGRILFPFYDYSGKLIFWNARTIFRGVKPKYLHASVPKSGKILIYEGKEREAWIVEGVFDAIAVNKLGKTAIMLMGSSISESLKSYLRMMKSSVVLCLDNDMTNKQFKYEKELKEILGEDKVKSLFLDGKDVSESGVAGEVGIAGYLKRKLKR
jgi:DNA primase